METRETADAEILNKAQNAGGTGQAASAEGLDGQHVCSGIVIDSINIEVSNFK